jgi:hypothetical protein
MSGQPGACCARAPTGHAAALPSSVMFVSIGPLRNRLRLDRDMRETIMSKTLLVLAATSTGGLNFSVVSSLFLAARALNSP